MVIVELALGMGAGGVEGWELLMRGRGKRRAADVMDKGVSVKEHIHCRNPELLASTFFC